LEEFTPHDDYCGIDAPERARRAAAAKLAATELEDNNAAGGGGDRQSRTHYSAKALALCIRDAARISKLQNVLSPAAVKVTLSHLERQK
jgi:hypothetical protein